MGVEGEKIRLSVRQEPPKGESHQTLSKTTKNYRSLRCKLELTKILSWNCIILRALRCFWSMLHGLERKVWWYIGLENILPAITRTVKSGICWKEFNDEITYIHLPQLTNKKLLSHHHLSSFSLFVIELSLSALLPGSGTKAKGHVSLRVHVDCFQKLWESLLTYLHPTSNEQWKRQVDLPKRLSSQGTLG